jgi:hypothetical protein
VCKYGKSEREGARERERERDTLKRFIKILMFSNELTYRTITAEFERSSNMSPNS